VTVISIGISIIIGLLLLAIITWAFIREESKGD